MNQKKKLYLMIGVVAIIIIAIIIAVSMLINKDKIKEENVPVDNGEPYAYFEAGGTTANIEIITDPNDLPKLDDGIYDWSEVYPYDEDGNYIGTETNANGEVITVTTALGETVSGDVTSVANVNTTVTVVTNAVSTETVTDSVSDNTVTVVSQPNVANSTTVKATTTKGNTTNAIVNVTTTAVTAKATTTKFKTTERNVVTSEEKIIIDEKPQSEVDSMTMQEQVNYYRQQENQISRELQNKYGYSYTKEDLSPEDVELYERYIFYHKQYMNKRTEIEDFSREAYNDFEDGEEEYVEEEEYEENENE
ncbi:MAG: hypothetical protein LBM93_13325 [Oscillospiraceae bacterium]|nr:hypothetical protein [Oscillospiraceae bacterium]